MTGQHRERIARVTAGSLLLGTVLSAFAAHALQHVPDLIGLPWMQVMVGCAISSWGGATATLGRYLAAAYDNRPFLWRAEVVRDVAVSVTVGSAGYLGGAWYGLGPLAVGVVLLLSGYLGVRVLSAAAERLLMTVSSKGQGGE